ncbi:hypothetical protein [Comamonas testosteroni]|uniref:hypothetical protein n=1 Tax=Comamonas testosteroni TaxID=285 RepID=UPI0005B3F256|nr:hypothetical protein [Comamonas testosteroni]
MIAIRARCTAGLLQLLARRQRTDRVSLPMWPTGADCGSAYGVEALAEQSKHFATHGRGAKAWFVNRPGLYPGFAGIRQCSQALDADGCE